ncbi:hypothetical protein OGAPHI_006646 [Ogataea philodendri]|uniref:Uncharacterized protein n=1 Tax=Ogataea philodendri TaxID=1378263 RepID=A0A9P8NXH6_9ASCO|nr:uncharacterized protein OGAPHI_006646 [Ogataea philodendri]KAH3661239.1 hypothetical protein OGAPHI_006646 [Ogataea philodendri]
MSLGRCRSQNHRNCSSVRVLAPALAPSSPQSARARTRPSPAAAASTPRSGRPSWSRASPQLFQEAQLGRWLQPQTQSSPEATGNARSATSRDHSQTPARHPAHAAAKQDTPGSPRCLCTPERSPKH